MHPLPWEWDQTEGRDSRLGDVKRIQRPSVTEQQTRHSWSLIQSCFEKSAAVYHPAAFHQAALAGSVLEELPSPSWGPWAHPSLSRCPLGPQITVALDSAKPSASPGVRAPWDGKKRKKEKALQGNHFSMAWGAGAAPGESSDPARWALPILFLLALEGSVLSSQSWVKTRICV